jgi:hypothetical protein
MQCKRNNLRHLSTEEPTYWPSDRNKIPDLMDFCVTKGIPLGFAVTKSRLDLSAYHSPVLTLTSHELNQEKQSRLSNRHTNWDDFRYLINQRLTLNASIKTEEDIEAAVRFTNSTIQCAGWNATPQRTDRLKAYDSDYIRPPTTNTREQKIIGLLFVHQRNCVLCLLYT